ncbi:MAG: hypothetical protein BGO70_03340 [Bacteroidetes bacterium 43-93]|nr:MAG: hypothetical protein BGO70_03340 [Bacteroidetes bacterium 43-93]
MQILKLKFVSTRTFVCISILSLMPACANAQSEDSDIPSFFPVIVFLICLFLFFFYIRSKSAIEKDVTQHDIKKKKNGQIRHRASAK